MATGLLKGGVDLDTLFLARVNTKRADVGIQVAGVDISNRFEAIGGGTPIANTGFRTGGVDIATMFRDISQALSSHTLTAGTHTTTIYTYTGFSTTFAIGSIAPGSYGGQTIAGLYDLQAEGWPELSGLFFALTGTPPQNFFSSIQVNGLTFLSSAAEYGFETYTIWHWLTKANLVNGNVYPVSINP